MFQTASVKDADIQKIHHRPAAQEMSRLQAPHVGIMKSNGSYIPLPAEER
jgi:hypothetical protein